MPKNTPETIYLDKLPREAYVVIDDQPPQKALVMEYNGLSKLTDTVIIGFTITSRSSNYAITGTFREVPCDSIFSSLKSAKEYHESIITENIKASAGYFNQNLACCENCVNCSYLKFRIPHCSNGFIVRPTGICRGFKFKPENKPDK